MTSREFQLVAIIGCLLLALIGVIAMGHGYPPWSGIKKDVVFSLPIDMGELAARLGSIVTFDRRGNVVYLSGFEEGLQEFTLSPSGGDSAVLLSTEYVKRGAYACKIYLDPAVQSTGGMEKKLPYPSLSKIGFEISFTWHTGIDHLDLILNLCDGTNRILFVLRLNPVAGQVQYLDDAGNYQNLGALPSWGTRLDQFHTAKLVADFSTTKYERAIVDDTTYVLSAYSGRQAAHAAAPYFSAHIYIVNNAGAATTNYLDDFIVTQTEP